MRLYRLRVARPDGIGRDFGLGRRLALLVPAMAAFGATHRAPAGRKFGPIHGIARVARGTGENHARPVEKHTENTGRGDHRKGANFFAALVQSVTGQAHIPTQIELRSAYGSL